MDKGLTCYKSPTKGFINCFGCLHCQQPGKESEVKLNHPCGHRGIPEDRMYFDIKHYKFGDWISLPPRWELSLVNVCSFQQTLPVLLQQG